MTERFFVDSPAASAAGALTPGFLIAPMTLQDGHFDGALVLLAGHDDSGSMGFIINKPSPLWLRPLLAELGIEATIPDRKVYLGGPVAPSSGFVLYEHEAGAPRGPGLSVSDRISVSPAKEVLELAARGHLPGRFELILGYAGWSDGQLDAELTRGSWLHAGFDAALLFDVDPDERWAECHARLGIDPLAFMMVKGGAQA